MRVDTKIQDVPKCTEPGCNKNAAIIRNYGNGISDFRKWCRFHHDRRTGAKHGVTSIVAVTAKKRKMSVTELKNSQHKYRKYRKDYCENIDGRVGGFKCTATIPWKGILQVDHIDGNPNNNDSSNLQTLCANCHTHKSNLNADYRTPGRKTLGKIPKQDITFKCG